LVTARRSGRTVLSDAAGTAWPVGKTASIRSWKVRENTRIGRVKSRATARARPEKVTAPCANRRPSEWLRIPRGGPRYEASTQGPQCPNPVLPSCRGAGPSALDLPDQRGRTVIPGSGTALVRAATVVPVILLVLYAWLLGMLGLLCGRERRKYVMN